MRVSAGIVASFITALIERIWPARTPLERRERWEAKQTRRAEKRKRKLEKRRRKQEQRRRNAT